MPVEGAAICIDLARLKPHHQVPDEVVLGVRRAPMARLTSCRHAQHIHLPSGRQQHPGVKVA